MDGQILSQCLRLQRDPQMKSEIISELPDERSQNPWRNSSCLESRSVTALRNSAGVAHASSHKNITDSKILIINCLLLVSCSKLLAFVPHPDVLRYRFLLAEVVIGDASLSTQKLLIYPPYSLM